MTESQPRFSFSHVLWIVLPLALLGGALYWWSTRWEPASRRDMASSVFARMLSNPAAPESAPLSFPDHDGDLLADVPADASQLVSPEVIKFSYVAGESENVPDDTWTELLAAIAAKTGKKVEYVHFTTTREQLAAMQKGELHIAGLHTGAVPTAVNVAGFVPICTIGREDGSFGNVTKIIVPAGSAIKTLGDIRGHKVMFARPESNSGCKAPLLLLRDEVDMLPDRDYEWGFSMSHEGSIQGIATKEFEVAPVAGDMLDRAIASGDVDADAVVTIYESERFPPAAIGCVYNLATELSDGIRETMLGFDWNGTKLQDAFGASAKKFVPVNYKDDWANIRRIDQSVAAARGDH